MSSTHLLTDEELAKVIAVSIKGFVETMGVVLSPEFIMKIKNSTLKAIDTENGINPQGETFSQEFVRIFDEEIAHII